MIHKDCGGKLVVVDSTKSPGSSRVTIFRVRKCQKCKCLIKSIETIRDAEIQQGYRHNMSYKEDK